MTQKRISPEQKTRWPYYFIQQVPNLLVKLLEQDRCQSLERLQLVGIKLNLRASAPLETTAVRDGDFLELNGSIDAAGLVIACSIKYYVRGARKFYRVPKEGDGTLQRLEMEALGADDIRDFFDEVGQLNSMLYDAPLAQLRGEKLEVPSQMIAWFMLEHALDIARDPCATFELSFHRAIDAGEPLTAGYRWRDAELVLELATKNGTAAVLIAF